MATIEHDLNLTALRDWAAERVPNALFWTVSGAHLYGFPSVDSDVDLRGCFLASLPELTGLHEPGETVEPKGYLGQLEVEGVSHELRKYCKLLTKANGYVLEQIFSPLVVSGQAFLDRLRPIASRCITVNCYHHYRGFLSTQRKLIEKADEVGAKPLLYAYRVVLTGIHLLQTGTVEAHLPSLLERFALPFIPDLIERKRAAEFGVLSNLDKAWHLNELARWEARMDEAHRDSTLPTEVPREELHQFILVERFRDS